MKRVKSFWRKDTKSNLKVGNIGGVKKVFGAPLNPRSPQVPDIIKSTTTYIEEFAIQEAGLFRVSGHHAEINLLKNSYDRGEKIDFTLITSLHAVSSVLKQYLRELPEPLFTFNSYDALITSYGVTDLEMRLACIKNVIQDLPRHYYVVLDWLFAFLFRVSLYAEYNKMDSSNLAICFAPNLLRSKSETTEQLVSDSHKSTAIVKMIIDSYSEIFEKDPVTGDTIEVQPLQPFISDDYLLPAKYHSINLDKEIAEIFEEEIEDQYNKQMQKDQKEKQIDQQQHHPQVGGVGHHHHHHKDRPTVFQIFSNTPSPTSPLSLNSSDNNLPEIDVIKINPTTNTIYEDEDQQDDDDDNDDDDDDDDNDDEEEEELSTSIKSISIATEQIRNTNNTPNHDSLNVSNNNVMALQGNNITDTDYKINSIKKLIDNTIVRLKEEFIQIAKDLDTEELSFQEILLIASSMKNIMNILFEGPDVDTKVVSSFELPLLDQSNSTSSDQLKRLETLKKAVVTRVTDSIPNLLIEISDEADNIVQSPDIEKEICLVDLITIVRTLRATGDLLTFFYNKWNQISPSSSPYISSSPKPISPQPPQQQQQQSTHQQQAQLLQQQSPLMISKSNSSNSSTSNSIPILLSHPSKSNLSYSISAPNSSILIGNINSNNSNITKSNSYSSSSNNNNQFSQQSINSFLASLKIYNDNDIIQRLITIDEILIEAEDSLMTVSSKSELIYLAKVISNIQKIIHLPLESAATFDDLPEIKNTLKPTPKQKLAPLISVVYVLIKEIRDQVEILKFKFEKKVNQQQQNSTSSGSNNIISPLSQKEIQSHTQRFQDLFRLLCKLPAYQTYKASQSQKEEATQRNIEFMKESISNTLAKLKPLFIVQKDLVNEPVTCNDVMKLDQLMKLTRNITRIKKLFEDPQILPLTGINFITNDSISNSPKSSSLSISSFLRNKTTQLFLNPKDQQQQQQQQQQQDFSEKIDTVKSLGSLLLDNVLNKFDYLEDIYSSIKEESQLFEVINLLKNVILIFKEIKNK